MEANKGLNKGALTSVLKDKLHFWEVFETDQVWKPEKTQSAIKIIKEVVIALARATVTIFKTNVENRATGFSDGLNVLCKRSRI